MPQNHPTTPEDVTAFVKALEEGRYDAAQAAILKHELGVIEGWDTTGRTPLVSMVLSVDKTAVAFLLKSGADVRTKDRDGNTAEEVTQRMKTLLKKSASATAESGMPLSAIAMAEERVEKMETILQILSAAHGNLDARRKEIRILRGKRLSALVHKGLDKGMPVAPTIRFPSPSGS